MRTELSLRAAGISLRSPDRKIFGHLADGVFLGAIIWYYDEAVIAPAAARQRRWQSAITAFQILIITVRNDVFYRPIFAHFTIIDV